MSTPAASLARPAPVPSLVFGAGAPAAPAPAFQGFGTLINLAGRQRMLSQRIVLFCTLSAQGDASALATAQEALTLFSESHARLLQSRGALQGRAAQVLQQAFHGPQGADAPAREFVRLAEETLNAIANALPTVRRLVPSLVARATPMLAQLNTLTQVYEALAGEAAQEEQQQQTALIQQIQHIAGEARLVSMNARVAAARAGDSGREFAVVVSTLAGISEQIATLSQAAMLRG
jgi:hypothetical protein